jgi:hypothetical protein
VVSQTRRRRKRVEPEVVILVDPDERLVADARGAMTPSQIVDQKLLAMLGTGHPGLFAQAVGQPHRKRNTGGA